MIIFSPGPANISDRVRQALTLPDICHRDEEFSTLLAEVKDLLKQALGARGESYEPVLLAGSGTLAIDSLIASLTGWDKTLLIISNGVYGKRAAEIARTYGVKIRVLESAWGEPPDMKTVEEEIGKPDIGGVYMVHHETTTGLLNPLEKVARLAKQHGKIALADTVSSVAGEELDLSWGLDAILGSSNKCFRGVPGVAFAIVSQDFINIAAKRERRTYYSDLITHLERERNNETPFTPPVHSMFAFREALRETLEEGIENRKAHYRRISELLRAGLKDIGLKFYLPDELYCNTMTSVYLPSGMTYRELHDKMKERGFIIYNSQGHLKEKNVFMLGIVGIITEQNIKDFLTALRETIGEKA